MTTESILTLLIVMAAWSAIILTIVGMTGTLIGFFILREWKRFEDSVNTVTQAQQREQRLMVVNTENLAKAVDMNSLERTNKTTERIERIEQWGDSQIKSDLEELRIRRMKDLNAAKQSQR